MNKKALQTLEYMKIIQKLTSYATSEPGKAKCTQLLPSDQIETIKTMQRQTGDALSRLFKKGSVSFGGAKDIRASLKRLEIGSTLGIPELLAVCGLLENCARVKSYGRPEISDAPPDSLTSTFDALESLTSLSTEIRRCILSEDEISDDASSTLRQIRRSMKLINDRIHSQLSSIVNGSARTYLQDAVITMRNGRYCIPVKAEYKNQVPGMIHDQSSTGSTLFIEPMAVIKLNNEMRELEIAEQKEIEAVLADLSSRLAPWTETILTNQQLLGQLDFIFARGALSRHYKGSQPKFNDKGIISIKDGRHPLLDPAKVVPITLTLGKDFDLLVVTGPNTGGKTVSLKTVGLFTLMGQAGLHIPAFEGSELAVFNEVFADIGDEQSIEQNLSTFSAHMTNTVRILQQADSHSLCLFDELGAGTDPTEGAALAIAILTFLHNMKCRTMATTHYSELKVFALSTPGVENACCEFNVETLQPTYRLLIGIPGKSNAFAISKKLGLPDFIIEDAKTHLEDSDEAFEDLLAHLEESRVTIEKEQAEIQSYKAEIAQLKARLTQKEERLDERKEKMIRNAAEEAQRILREAKETADQTIKEINKLSADSGLNRQLEAQRTKLRDKLKATDEKLAIKQKGPQKTISPKKLKIGDGVKVLTLGLKGTVSTLPNEKGDLYVQMGILRSLVNIKDLELLKEQDITGPSLNTASSSRKGSGSRIPTGKAATISPEINLIGMNVDEACSVLDKYLDDAYLSRLPSVRVVHGRGTGALRAGIHKYLKRLKYVKEFHLGEFGEGDSGVTIVTFK